MSNIQSKVTCFIKDEKNYILNEARQAIDANIKMMI